MTPRTWGLKIWKITIYGSKIKIDVNFIYGYQNLSGEKYKTNEERISSIGLTSLEKNPKNHPKMQFSRKVTFWVVFGIFLLSKTWEGMYKQGLSTKSEADKGSGAEQR